jgi:hypothetical protein
MELALSLLLLVAPQAGDAAWESLAKEYEQAYLHWSSELSRSGGGEAAERAPVTTPVTTFWPRFEELSRAGEGRATVWLLQNLASAPEKEEAIEPLLARVRAGGADPWVARALVELFGQASALPAAEMAKMKEYLGQLDVAARESELRVALLLLRAALTPEAAQRAEVMLHAAFLRWKGVELGADERIEGERVGELATAVLSGLRSSRWFQVNMFQGPEGGFYPHALFDPDPRVTWRPAIDALAERGSVEARLWMVTSFVLETEEDHARFRAHLDAAIQGPLSSKQRKNLLRSLAGWTPLFGSDFVEPRIRALLAGAPESEQAQLLLELADSLHRNSDEAMRERGLALLGEVIDRWPSSEQATRARGTLFSLANIVVGKVAPDFETADVDGNAFKLSDYKGKVLLIDFWAFW